MGARSSLSSQVLQLNKGRRTSFRILLEVTMGSGGGGTFYVKRSAISASGGTVSDETDGGVSYTVHTFTSSSGSVVSS